MKAVAWLIIALVVTARPDACSAQPLGTMVPADGKKHKIEYNRETYKVTISGNRIVVLHIPKVFGRKRGHDVREWTREVARHASGCSYRDEYFNPMSLALEAELVCISNQKGAGS